MPSELHASRAAGRVWAAVREGGRTVELHVEPDGQRALAPGRIVKGRVSRVLPGIQAAFVDIGESRDAFVHVSDVPVPGALPIRRLPRAWEALDPEEHSSDPPPPATLGGAARIEDVVREGTEIVVQIVRGPVQSKGPRASGYPSLAGRGLVYFPTVDVRAVSRRIADPDERERLRGVVAGIPVEGGLVARTAAEGVSEDRLAAEAHGLAAAWAAIAERARAEPAPVVLRREPDVLERLLRDAPAGGYERVVVDDRELEARALELLPTLAAGGVVTVERRASGEVFRDLAQQVDQALAPRVHLPSGGDLVIEPTEALVSVDVNTARHVGTAGGRDTVLTTNLEAAGEIGVQLRLRDLAGSIAVDFIDMSSEAARARVIEALEQALRGDRARTRITPLAEGGLVHVARERRRQPLFASVTRACPSCRGTGRVASAEIVAERARREIERLAAALEAECVVLRAHPEVVAAFRRLYLKEGTAVSEAPYRVEVVEDGAVDRGDYELEAS